MTHKLQLFESLKTIPIAINVSYGDAFQPSQWNDTLTKLDSLQKTGHSGPIMVGTKYIISDKQLDYLSSLYPKIWLFISITGLNETNLFTFKEYGEFYIKACTKINNVVCAIRPIIPFKNDSLEILSPIIDLVADGGKKLTYTGFRDSQIQGSPKYFNDKLFNQINELCAKKNILCKEKCACIISAAIKEPCPVHSKSSPINIELIKALGYNFSLNENGLNLLGYKNSLTITKGDLSFIRILSKSSFIYNYNSPSEILSLKTKNYKYLVCTSSWFNWSKQVYCDVNCSYCFANYNSKVRIDLDDFGCNPTFLIDDLNA